MMIKEDEIKNALNKFVAETQLEFTPEGVFFDMDGVLFDSMPLHAKSWTETFKEYGINLSKKDPYLNEGSTAVFTVRKMFQKYLGETVSDETISEIRQKKHDLMAGMPLPKVMLFMPALVEETVKSGLKTWVVTGSGQETIIARLEKEYAGNLKRERMITAFDVKIGKPNPEPYLMAMKKSGMDSSQAFVVENAPLGVQSAKAAGLFTVAVNTGLLDREDLLEAGADLVFESSEELAKNWQCLLSTLHKIEITAP